MNSKINLFDGGAEAGAPVIAELLMLEGVKAFAHYHHPFFERWRAFPRDGYRRKSVAYEGAVVSHTKLMW